MCETDWAVGSVRCLARSPSSGFSGRFVIVGNRGRGGNGIFCATTKQNHNPQIQIWKVLAPMEPMPWKSLEGYKVRLEIIFPLNDLFEILHIALTSTFIYYSRMAGKIKCISVI
jgi:hypothetical protein